ncbi:hypothetical protein ACCO45_006470 [Purpureocillium lilacinum]|uniref:Uncharacterized protein n=1 Tax=Purpureocillium lilacinum TaxID=33203 RepID=A0ACC4DQM7_PURLI
MRGAEQGGAVGAARGAGVGILNFGAKVSSGALGLVTYSGQGLYQSMRSTAREGDEPAGQGGQARRGAAIVRAFVAGNGECGQC